MPQPLLLSAQSPGDRQRSHRRRDLLQALLYINGEKQDYDADLVSQDGDDLTYKVKDKNGNEFTYEENSNSVMVKSDGDTQGDVEIEVDGSVPSAD